jgi:hypothetical protein
MEQMYGDAQRRDQYGNQFENVQIGGQQVDLAPANGPSYAEV